jgi:glutamyl-tRNA synthetase
MNPIKEKLKLVETGNIRVRYAPSPTGLFHIGGARSTLFNYLFSKKYKGSFILRIEDTDKERSEDRYEKDILDSLKWLGLYWDEGPENLGDFGPYKQSERGYIYKKYIKKLLDEKKAYYCFCTPEELESQKQYQMARGEVPKYNGKCREIDSNQALEKIRNNRYVIRIKTPEKKIKFKDIIRGEIEFDTNEIGDIVIAKNHETPLYNLAVVIDDYEMKISHVIRGEDHISNTPKQILLIEALGFNIPNYAHLPLVLGPDKSKLSKRHGAVSVTDYQKQGYLPESIINMLALLGWNPGNDREIYSIQQLINDFSLEKIQKSGAVFNIKKLDFLNGFYIRQKSIENLTHLSIPYLVEANLIKKELSGNYLIMETKESVDIKFIEKIVSISQQRLKKLTEIVEYSSFFFKKKLDYEKNLLIWKETSDEETLKNIDKIENILLKIEKWTNDNLEKEIMNEAEKTGDRGKILWPLRAALTGEKSSPGPIEILEIMGKEKSIERIKQAKQRLN